MSAGHRVSRPTIRWIRRDLPGEAVTRAHGMSITSADRTLADVLLTAAQPDAMWIVDQALRCEPLLAQLVVPLLVGRGARRALARLARAEPNPESPLETLARLLLRRNRMPVVVQHQVRDNVGRVIARVDLALPELRIAIESDGSGPHGGPAALFRDRRRENALVALGWTVLRFTWRDITNDPAQVVAEVRSTMDRLRHVHHAAPGLVSRKDGLLGSI